MSLQVPGGCLRTLKQHESLHLFEQCIPPLFANRRLSALGCFRRSNLQCDWDPKEAGFVHFLSVRASAPRCGLIGGSNLVARG